MHRFYCPELSLVQIGGPGPADGVHLDRDEAHHARKVLRLPLGADIGLFDGQGRLGGGVIEAWEAGALVRVKEVRLVQPLHPQVVVASALPKGPRADDMVEQLSQLGADGLIPLRTARSIVDPRESKIEKFARAAIESAKQCGRAHLMHVAGPLSFEDALRQPADLRLIAAPGSQASPDIHQRLRQAHRVLILIGPEGGWTDQELAAAQQAGCIPWRLGPHILRIETAAAAALALARYLTADFESSPQAL